MKKRLTLILTALLMSMVCLQAQPIQEGKVFKTVPFKARAKANRAVEAEKGATATLKYEKVADMKTARIGHQIFPTAGGGVVVVGGHTTNFALTTSAELYQNGQWRDLSISSPHDGAFSVILNDGRVMVGGGYSSNSGVGQSKRVDIWDPSTQSFSKGPDLSVARANCKAIAMSKGVYVVGNWYAEDETFDYYNGSTFSSVGYTLPRTSPYLYTNNSSEMYILAPTDNYGKEVELEKNKSGELRFPGLFYDESDGKTYYMFYSVYVDNKPLLLPSEFRTTDYYCKEYECYFILTKKGNEYLITAPAPALETTYTLPTVKIPTSDPKTNAAISWRGGVFVNEAKHELYLIGSSGTATNQTVYIYNYNYEEDVWTLASAEGFNYDLMGGSWSLLPDGRLMCAGGSGGDNFTAKKDVCIFTLPTDGTEDNPDPGPNPYNPDPDPVPTGAMADSLVSNYGNWMNLTNGYSDWSSSGPQKMEVQLDGNFIHLIWMDGNTDADNATRIWYRRSTDSGKTWEDARVLTTTRFHSWGQIDGTNKLMCVNNGRIHFAVHDKEGEATMIRYIRSDDYGATFQEPVIVKKSDIWAVAIRNSLIDSDGEMVVISTVQAEAVGYGAVIHPRFLVSKDHGQTFTELSISENNIDLFDLKVSNGRFVTLGNRTSISYGLQKGEILITAYDGSDFITTQVAPVQSDDKPYGEVNINTDNYHPQMAIVGNTIHLMYRGAPENSDPVKDIAHTLYQKSTDFGKTWTKAYNLPESEGGGGMIVAKGQNVYILTSATAARQVVYYSHDSGNTWNIQDKLNWPGTQGNYNPRNYFSLAIALDDPTGNHVYFTGNRFFFAETKDGFKSFSKNSVLGSDAWPRTGWNNYGLMVLGDQNGQEHWFMQFSRRAMAKYPDGRDYLKEDFSRDICYRRPQAEPAPTKEAAMDLTLANTGIVTYIEKRVVIPMTPSLQLKDAMTVETWVYVEDRMSFQIAANTDLITQSGSKSTIGWYIHLNAPGGTDWLTIEAGKENAAVVSSNGDYFKLEQKKWHHVAVTYDAHLAENNFCLYVDGILVGRVTSGGPIMDNVNPICLGNAEIFGSKGMLDDFSIWSRALTQEEILSHIYKTPDGKDKDCRVLLTFNNTLRDESQYHNDALAQLDVNFVEHETINPPHTDFVMAKDQTGKNVTLSDATVDGKGLFWIWGTNSWNYSSDHNVKLTNMQPNNYIVKMVAASDNACAGAAKQISIAGLSRVEPSKAGLTTGARLKILGGYDLTYSNQPMVKLHNAKGDIEGKWLVDRNYNSRNIANTDDMAPALFDLSNAQLGVYDVIVGKDTLKNAFTVEAGKAPEVWFQVNGTNQMMKNKWTQFSIEFGNRSNVAAYNIPFYLFIADKEGAVDVSFDFEVQQFSDDINSEVKKFFDEVKDGVVIDTEVGKMRCYSFLIPYIAPNGNGRLTYHIKHRDNNTSNTIDFAYAYGDPFGAYDPDYAGYTDPTRADDGIPVIHDKWNTALAECFINDYLHGWFKDAAAGSIPFVNCAYYGKKTYASWNDNIYNNWVVADLFMNAASTVVSCVGSVVNVIAPPSWLLTTAFSIVWSGIGNIVSAKVCMSKYGDKKNVKSVNSLDPNEMIGPSGYDDQKHFIKPIHNMSYMVTYENKAEATAPANEVFIRDTLDVSKYDLATFGFTGYGWNNQSYNVGGSQTKEFTRDISYKVNGNDIIVRVSGQFDEKTGIAAWSFVSLDKNDKELQDIMQGFLPPNNADGIGEGFVTFSVEHKANPANGSSVSNKATIVFDYNKPIVTNTYVNTFDTDYPSSSITKVEEKDGKLVVTLSGSDATSGIGTYHIFAFKNGGEAELVATVTQDNQATFTCEPGTKYGLCVIATDNVGWNEPKDIKAEIEVTTSGTGINNILIDNPSANDFIDLQGRRVKAPKASGIYIQNKKKVVVK